MKNCLSPGVPAPQWVARSALGLLQRDATESGRLVRLEDVADWMAANAVRQEAVAYEIFGALVRDEGREARHLHLVNMRGYAVPFVEPCEGPAGPYLLTLETGLVWSALPGLVRGSGLDDLARVLGEGWRRVWGVPALSDMDHEWRAERLIERNRERGAAAVAAEAGGAFEEWPEDGVLLRMLERVAIPLAKAAELWGYGRAAQSVLSVVEEVFPLADLAALAAYRDKVPKPSWATGNQIVVARREIDAHGVDVVAERLGVTRQALSSAVNRERKRKSVASPLPSAESSIAVPAR